MKKRKKAKGKGSDDMSFEWILVIVLVIAGGFAFYNESGSAKGIGGMTSAPAGGGQPPARMSSGSSLSSTQSYAVSFSCAAFKGAVGGGLRVVSPEILRLCQLCEQGNQSACERVNSYIERQN